MLGFTTAKARALADRPGWTAGSGREARALGERYPAGSRRPFDWHDNVFDLLLRGPLPGGADAETFRVGHRYGRGKGSTVRWYTFAAVEFPRELPSVSLDSTSDPADAQPSAAGAGLVWTQGTRGPHFAGLRGYADDPRAGAALFTPEVLTGTRALRIDWRFDGSRACGVVREVMQPQQMLTLVDFLAWLGGHVG
ncbi:hypothetical protein [Streptacidiphilus fuscans]|uniref:Uncharacterized protein n=1 Tax=Streptacidiphilus fuscans TaxID=2789292 RepID=A0A931B1Q5_9ACTN|nr:hypothetical protein [Streptacidiphilus fuscans]MBF9067321.1 hypothetical protein [Streptacidiphilus fuscans]